jgi:hypothetical protein
MGSFPMEGRRRLEVQHCFSEDAEAVARQLDIRNTKQAHPSCYIGFGSIKES